MSYIQTNPDDLAYKLPAEAMYQLLYDLRQTLPPPPASPEARKRRDHAIIARISALRPADQGEAGFVAQVVAAHEQWNDCLRLAQLHFAAGNHALGRQCRAEAATMMRQGQSAMRVLLKMQAERRKIYADTEATDTAERLEHINLVMLAEGLAQMHEQEEQEHDSPPIIENLVAPAVLTEPPAQPPQAHLTPATAVASRDPDPVPASARPAEPAKAARPRSPVSPHDSESRKTKTEIPARQSDRPYESPARLAMIDKFLFAPRGPDWDRPMFFPEKPAAKPPRSTETQSDGSPKVATEP